MISSFTNKYKLSKTLRFSLIPQGDTEKFFELNDMLSEDEERAKNYEKVKEYIDRYHKAYIESILAPLCLDGLKEYSQLYYKQNKTDQEKKQLVKLEDNMRKDIADALSTDKKKLFQKEIIEEILPSFLTEKEEIETVESFKGFSTYFVGFHKNRENMYVKDAKSTAIGYRCINQNLPRFLDNAKSFTQKIKDALAPETIEALNDDISCFGDFRLEDYFVPEAFSFALSQKEIEEYNNILGGYTTSDGSKVQGLNEYINLYNQQVAKADKSKRLPKLKPLYKQILSDRESISFIPKQFEDDDTLLKAVYDFYNTSEESKSIKERIGDIRKLFSDMSSFDLNGIYLPMIQISALSQQICESWSKVSQAWNDEYDSLNLKKKSPDEKYIDKRSKAYKALNSMSLADFVRYGGLTAEELNNSVQSKVTELCDAVEKAYAEGEQLFSTPYTNEKVLAKNDTAIEQIKIFLDSIKTLERYLYTFAGSGKEEVKDETFYGEYTANYSDLTTIDRLYDSVRNYVTKKPYSTDKIKLNFSNPQFMGGWDRNKERDYLTVILRKDGLYYLGIMNKGNNKIFMDYPTVPDGNGYEKITYKLLPGPSKMLPKVFFASSNIDVFQPSSEVERIRREETFKKGDNFSLSDCHKLIDFYKDSINKCEWANYDFKFKDTSEYKDISGFYREVENQGYKITYDSVDPAYIDSLVSEGKLYLFQIYNKDFSRYSKGKPNLHTMYFKMLFDEENLKDVVYKLNGEAEMFYRKSSIKEKDIITHPANQPINNKNDLNEKRQSTFDYELIKDRRYTKRQFLLHLPITMNFKCGDISYMNEEVRHSIKKEGKKYVIGIDRGERHLIYICVTDPEGKIVYQRSLNEIVSDYNGGKTRVNYHDILAKRESERADARRSWKEIGTIKELKEGYISCVVHEICKLVVKYDAVIAMEDLNSGFKNSRVKVEKQVYQKFEKMLIDKLNYFVLKENDATEPGGVLKAYQLTEKFESFAKMGKQNGIIFYIPAWLTSKIDPDTGFVNLLKTKYTSVPASQQFFGKFNSIEYNKNTEMFEFTFDYSNFERADADYRKVWTVCTNGERLENFRNADKNSSYDTRVVDLTTELKALFEKYGIDINSDLKEQICSCEQKQFFEKLLRLLSLTLQLRNSRSGTDEDYLISPVRNAKGDFYDSRNYSGTDAILPCDADANGAYNIARKGIWAQEVIASSGDDDMRKINLAISNKAWLEYAQNK